MNLALWSLAAVRELLGVTIGAGKGRTLVLVLVIRWCIFLLFNAWDFRIFAMVAVRHDYRLNKKRYILDEHWPF